MHVHVGQQDKMNDVWMHNIHVKCIYILQCSYKYTGAYCPQPHWNLHVIHFHLELPKTTHNTGSLWLWVYDNLNIHQHVRHERSGKENSTIIDVHEIALQFCT